MGYPIVVVCGGLHPPSYNGQILTILATDAVLSQLPVLAFAPSWPLAVLSPYVLRQWLEERLMQLSLAPDSGPNADRVLIIWAFSAGCVGAVALAEHWQRHRGQVLALFLVDGWGVPRVTRVPIHRLSHDRFTHTTSRWLGTGTLDFYADPAVPHLQLWQSPQQVNGWPVNQSDSAPGHRIMTAAEFLCQQSQPTFSPNIQSLSLKNTT
ncbi:MAG: hypothetical protein HC922_00225 [Leptolyngbyaceae cyanobacterium SM2_3_12]|nr:hypothetical protein [Leptolyngbyaceae cyanobacterium SM2_3_12]